MSMDGQEYRVQISKVILYDENDNEIKIPNKYEIRASITDLTKTHPSWFQNENGLLNLSIFHQPEYEFNLSFKTNNFEFQGEQ